MPFRAICLLAAVLLAYHYSLLTLIRGITLQTPLAYLSLVPLIALVLAGVRLARQPIARPIHDRQVDYIIGIALIAFALAISLLLPLTLPTRFWLYRFDLVSLPFFVAGSVSVLYGIRQAWSLRFPIAFLFLAWPVPYLPLVGQGLELFTDLTAGAAALLTGILPFASTTGSDGLFLIQNSAQPFIVSVGSACAGVNSMVGFFLVGGAIASVVRGTVRRRIAWLIAGLLVTWLLNVLRIELIFLVGALFGHGAAINVLHPYAGLVTFNIGMFGMLLLLPRFGLDFSRGGLPARSEPRPEAVKRIRAAATMVILVATLFAVFNAGYTRYSPFAGDLGEPRLGAFDLAESADTGWTMQPLTTYAYAKQYFGENSSWTRSVYSAHPSTSFRASIPIYVDVITTDDASALADYGVEACYSFHNFTIESGALIDLGGGITAEVISYRNPKRNSDWSALWWEWPYRDGDAIRFARIIMLIPDGPNAQFAGPVDETFRSTSQRFAQAEQFLVTAARRMLANELESVRRASDA